MGTTGKHFRKRNPQRKKLVESLLKNNGKMSVAYKEAGYASIQSAQNALRFVRGELLQALVNDGWDAEAIIRKCLGPKLQAKKTLYFSSNGIVMDKRVVEDRSTQLAALDMWLKIAGGYAPTQLEHIGQVEHVLTAKEKQEAVESLRRIEAFESESENPLVAETVDEGPDA